MFISCRGQLAGGDSDFDASSPTAGMLASALFHVRRCASKAFASHRENGRSDECNVRLETLGMTTGSKMS
jgi:hypothetical protein